VHIYTAHMRTHSSGRGKISSRWWVEGVTVSPCVGVVQCGWQPAGGRGVVNALGRLDWVGGREPGTTQCGCIGWGGFFFSGFTGSPVSHTQSPQLTVRCWWHCRATRTWTRTRSSTPSALNSVGESVGCCVCECTCVCVCVYVCVCVFPVEYSMSGID
jgi:hypothetical protein